MVQYEKVIPNQVVERLFYSKALRKAIHILTFVFSQNSKHGIFCIFCIYGMYCVKIVSRKYNKISFKTGEAIFDLKTNVFDLKIYTFDLKTYVFRPTYFRKI